MRMIRSWVADYLAAQSPRNSFNATGGTGCGCRWLMVDNACDPDGLRSALATVKPSAEAWKQFKTGKLQFSNVSKLTEPLRNLFAELQGPAIVQALATLSGVPDLSPDETFSGAGLHATPRSGRLGIHVDFNRHRDGRFRRLNLFLFGGNGRTWRSEWEGALELWDADCRRASVEILPCFNRLVIFESTETSWHGQPIPLKCPDGQFRLSLACYYFSKSQPTDYLERHSTIYRES
jgi:hypothetical protein